jgi:hypothetical protein
MIPKCLAPERMLIYSPVEMLKSPSLTSTVERVLFFFDSPCLFYVSIHFNKIFAGINIEA